MRTHLRRDARWTAAVTHTTPDQTDPPPQPWDDTPTASYPYRDVDGTLLYTVHRHPRKRFVIEASDGTRLPDPIPARLGILYRLPDLAATPDGATILVAEGEKDVDTLTGHGWTATSNPCGTRMGWKAHYSPHLTGKHVVLIPDADGPGQRHATAVTRALAGIAASVVTVQLHTRGPWDVTDWLDRPRNTPAKLADRIALARLATAGLTKTRLTVADQWRLILGADLHPTQRHVLHALHALTSTSPGALTARHLADATGLHRVTAQDTITALRHQGVLSGHAIDWPVLAVTQRPPANTSQ